VAGIGRHPAAIVSRGRHPQKGNRVIPVLALGTGVGIVGLLVIILIVIIVLRVI
jgi:hypothetical protein